MEYNDNTVLSWGPYAGQALKDMPASYKLWMLNTIRRKDLDLSLKQYLKANEDKFKAEVNQHQDAD